MYIRGLQCSKTFGMAQREVIYQQLLTNHYKISLKQVKKAKFSKFLELNITKPPNNIPGSVS